jgi:hypothetical protein
MKKIFLFPLLIYAILSADSNYELKLFETIMPSIFKNNPIRVYLDDDMRDLLKDSEVFEIVDNCNADVDLLIGKKCLNLQPECKDKALFSTSYRSFKKNKNSFGAFYWRKGRPQLKFNSEVMKRYRIDLPQNLQRYKQ